MKILYLRTVFWFDLKSGGSVGHTSGVINAMSKNNRVDVISNDNLEGVQPQITLISPAILKYIPSRLGELFYNIILIKKLNKLISNYDFIYHRYSGLSFAPVYLSKKHSVPLILEFNASDVWMLRNWWKQSSILFSIIAFMVNTIKIPIVKLIEKYNLQNSILIIVPSVALKETLTKFHIPERKVLVNPNGVDQQRYSPTIPGHEILARYRLENQKVIGFIGTFAQWHGVLEMARAIQLFFKLNPSKTREVKFLLVGDGRLMPAVKKIINSSGHQNNVIFAGRVAQTGGSKYLAACDILLSPHIKNPDGSRFFGSPTKIFEYMAMGKAIIASDLDQIGQVLEHGKTAYLVEPGDIYQLVNAMKLLLSDTKLNKQLGKNARLEVLRKYTWEKHVDKILFNLDKIKATR